MYIVEINIIGTESGKPDDVVLYDLTHRMFTVFK